MPPAQQLFIERIYNFKDSLNADTLNDHVATDIQHNSIARILRNGLAVVGFVALEDFIKMRTIEVLKVVGRTTVTFNELPEKLRFSTTVDVLHALNRLVKHEPTQSDKIAFIQGQSNLISSTATPRYELTDFAFGYKSSNLDDEEIGRILNAFNIDNGWNKMSAISARLGLTAFPLKNSFNNAANRRHRAAHVAGSVIPINDLEQYFKEAVGIAIGFDSLLTKALTFIRGHSVQYLNNGINIDYTLMNFSFIRLENRTWKYRRDRFRRADKQDRNILDLFTYAIPQAQTRQETLIIYNENAEIEDWYCF